MNLERGKPAGPGGYQAQLERLPGYVRAALAEPLLQPETVIFACEKLLMGLSAEELKMRLQLAGTSSWQMEWAIEEVRLRLSREYIAGRLCRELGRKDIRFGWAEENGNALYPLGILVHVAAGNARGLPAFSVIEGLLTGNVCILKLPRGDDGLSAELLRRLCEIEPALCPYVHVLDAPSSDLAAMGRLAALADGVVVWGGDEAVKAIRSLIKPQTRLIEWGHRLSFGYVTRAGREPVGLADLAGHIAETDQLLCSSCQGIFLDGEDEALLQEFAVEFLPVLEEACAARPRALPLAVQGGIGLRLQDAALFSALGTGGVYRGAGCALLTDLDRALSAAIPFRHPWVRLLPREEILSALLPYRGYLQTAGLLCGEDEREGIANLLLRAGVNRVTKPGEMSREAPEEARDGEAPLRRYIRVVTVG